MAEKKTGAIILAAGKSGSADGPGPMRKVGRTTMIQKEIDTLRQAGIRPIVVITGYQADILEHHIAHRGAVFVRNKNYEKSQMFDSVCLGLKYMQKKVDRVLLFPADIPMVSAGTILRMKAEPGAITVPVCDGRPGHPVMLDKSVFAAILAYRGDRGLRGAMDSCGAGISLIELDDQGVVMDANTEQDYEMILQYEKENRDQVDLAFDVQVNLNKFSRCFDGELACFLEAVEEIGSMLGACQLREISYSKGWKMVKNAEDQLGIEFLVRQAGGSKGGVSFLTGEGKAFLRKYRELEERLEQYAERAFQDIFGDGGV